MAYCFIDGKEIDEIQFRKKFPIKFNSIIKTPDDKWIKTTRQCIQSINYITETDSFIVHTQQDRLNWETDTHLKPSTMEFSEKFCYTMLGLNLKEKMKINESTTRKNKTNR
jgi:hypothetical protein